MTEFGFSNIHASFLYIQTAHGVSCGWCSLLLLCIATVMSSSSAITDPLWDDDDGDAATDEVCLVDHGPEQPQFDHPSRSPSMTLCVVPGLGNAINSDSYWRRLFRGTLPQIRKVNSLSDNNYKDTDLGQQRCVNEFMSTYNSIPKDWPIVIHACSQGTATVINALCSRHTESWSRYVRLVVLESAIATSNSAMWHVATHNPKMPVGPAGACILSWMGCQFWLPWLAKLCFFRHYRPTDLQPIKHIDKFPEDIPVLLIHARNDQLVSFDDALALMHRLSVRNRNVFFIEVDGDRHGELFTRDMRIWTTADVSVVFEYDKFVQAAIERDTEKMYSFCSRYSHTVHPARGVASVLATINAPSIAYANLLCRERWMPVAPFALLVMLFCFVAALVVIFMSVFAR